MHVAVRHRRHLLPAAWAALAAVAAGVWLTGRAVGSADLAVLLAGAASAWALLGGGPWRVPLACGPPAALAAAGGLWGTAAVFAVTAVLGMPHRRAVRVPRRLTYRPVDPPVADDPGDEFEADAPAPHADPPTHWLRRTRTSGGGERVEGETTVPFAAGQGAAAGHVVFFPPLAAAPAVHAEPHDFGVRVRVTAATPGGFRFEVKRDAADAAEVRVAWWGVASPS